MDKYNVKFPCEGILFWNNKDKVLIYIKTWKNVKNTVTENRQPRTTFPKTQYKMFRLVCGIQTESRLVINSIL